MSSLYGFQSETISQWDPKDFQDRSALLGDDMGLGKTVQAIALDVKRRRHFNCDYTAQTLVVTKMSVMGSWEEHYGDWAPKLNVFVMDPKKRQAFIAAFNEKDALGLPKYQVFICHWQVLRFIADEIKKVAWFHVIGDEIQAIKNRKAQVTRAFKAMKPYYRSGLSGTWADNTPPDAYSILNWLWPSVFKSFKQFDDYHTLYALKEKKDGTKYRVIIGTANVEEMHSHMGTAGKGYIRRTKEQVLKDLPEKYYSKIEVELHPQQQRAYDQMRDNMLAWVGANETEPIAAPVVIAKLVRLQQFAVAYGRLETVLKRAKNHKYPVGEMARCRYERPHPSHGDCSGEHPYLLDDDGKIILNPLEVLRLTDPSSKLDAVMDLLEETNDQVVVFGQSKQVINLLAGRLESAGIPSGVLTGDTPSKDRHKLVQEFQSGRTRVFAGTVSAGGVGITLTAASTLIRIDRPWSPSVDKQAEDRLHRLGQKNAVHIIDLVARGTIDARRNRQIDMKWGWIKEILGDKSTNPYAKV